MKFACALVKHFIFIFTKSFVFNLNCQKEETRVTGITNNHLHNCLSPAGCLRTNRLRNLFLLKALEQTEQLLPSKELKFACALVKHFIFIFIKSFVFKLPKRGNACHRYNQQSPAQLFVARRLFKNSRRLRNLFLLKALEQEQSQRRARNYPQITDIFCNPDKGNIRRTGVLFFQSKFCLLHE